MKVLIDIDENVYTRLFDNGVSPSKSDRVSIETAIRNGKVLPKGHGDLIDIDAVFDEYDRTPKTMVSIVTDAPVVIEADEEGKE